MIDTGCLPRQINRKIGRALHDYRMLADGDNVMVAVSGGIDSLVAAWVLKAWQSKAPIAYSLEAVFVNNGYWHEKSGVEQPEAVIARQMKRFEINFSEIKSFSAGSGGSENCFECSRNRRTQLFSLARDRGVQKLAFGHHKDDLLETFFLNTFYSGNISTMRPRQELFEGTLSLIRVLSYLEKSEVLTIAGKVGLKPAVNLCPMSGDSRREKVRKLLGQIYREIPGAKSSVFAALGNIRAEYLLD